MAKKPSGAKQSRGERVEVGPQLEAASSRTDGTPPADAAFPIVGIGASAGGLAAFEAFFSAMPASTRPGVAFVLVQHLAPDHKSILRDLISRYTPMEVFEVEDGMIVRSNCAYIIPPNRDMVLSHGRLQLMEPSAPRGRRLPIDSFFRSMAEDLHERAICIVLSGTGTDGTLGLRAVKGEGGMAMVQSPDSAEFDGMPRSALDTQLVDYELAPAEMPARLLEYVRRAYRKPALATLAAPTTDDALTKICELLRAQTGHDFALYKPNTLVRRIERRMAVRQCATMDEYIEQLQRAPQEIEALFRDLLIGVTNFFRDPEAFAALEEQVIPELFANKPAGAVVRVWCAGCSSGEEAYSIAILLQEHIERLKLNYRVQLFATDIDARAIATARTGRYPMSIAADISPVRLARFFSADAEANVYRVHKTIRDMVIFSEQDLVRDPPLSKMDLISCRNLLIYLGSELQHKVVPIFHYALNPSGYLFLGTSESSGDFADLFDAVDRKYKLFRRKEHGSRAAVPRFATATAIAPHEPSLSHGRALAAKQLPLRQITEQALLQQLAPAAVLVNRQGDVLYLYGRTGSYLEPSPGEAGTSNILRMAREGLLGDLTVALRGAAAEGRVIRREGLHVKTNGDFTTVNLTVRPVGPEPSAGSEVLFLVIFEDAAASKVTAASWVDAPAPDQAATTAAVEVVGPAKVERPDADAQARIAALVEQLRAKEEYLQSTSREREMAHEELKSANEEMQSINEELQSTNEELETSKEELQSVNEELATVNTELQTKVTDLSRVNNDMNNLLAGTNIGTVFVDHQLHILRFTPAVTQIIRLIAADVGRPVGDIVSQLVGYDELVRDTQVVLDTLIPKEIEVRTKTGALYAMRILPYRTLENVIEGAVITFVDITKMKLAEQALRESEDRYRNLITLAPDAVLIDHDDTIVLVNQACVRLCGAQDESGLIGRSVYDLFQSVSRTAVRAQLHRLRQGAEPTTSLDAQIERPDGSLVDVEVLATALLQGPTSDLHVIIRDATLRKQAVAALHESESRVRQVAEALPQLVWTSQADGACDYVSPQWVEFTGVPAAEQVGSGWLAQVHPDERAAVSSAWTAAFSIGEPFRSSLRIRHHGGDYRWFDTHVSPLRDAAGNIVKWFGASLERP